MECPICNKEISYDIDNHVQKCLFLHERDESPKYFEKNKRKSSSKSEITQKKLKRDESTSSKSFMELNKSPGCDNKSKIKSKTVDIHDIKLKTAQPTKEMDVPDESDVKILVTPKLEETGINASKLATSSSKPLAETMRPDCLEQYVGQEHILGGGTMLRTLLEQTDIPSMILWGPPGCGKTTLAYIIANKCKETQSIRFVKLSATMAGVNDVKEIIKVAKNEQKFKRRTILFMDEIHRFNKMQQDTFLPHVESGTITLIGATTENPSFSLNNALLSRCRVIVLQKLEIEDLFKILSRALLAFKGFLINDPKDIEFIKNTSNPPKLLVEKASLQWLAEVCDGDARIALNSLQLAVQSTISDTSNQLCTYLMSLDNIKDGIKRSHIMYDSKGDQHYDTISALHKSIRASDANAALYWCTRMLKGGDDPRFIARRLMRAASEDIGLADPQALPLAVAAAQGAQLIGMPECDVLLAHCAVYLAKAPKSQEVYKALLECGKSIEDCRGSLPSVPMHLRNAPTKLLKELGCGKGYNSRHKDESNLCYMPEGMQDVYFLD